MFNTSNGYSLADIAAATGGNGYRNGDDGMWGNGAWWIIILFLFCFNGWGGNGWGNGANGSGYQGTTTREELTYGFDMSDIKSGINSLQTGLCNGFAGVNNNLLAGFAGVTETLNGNARTLQSDISNLGMNAMQNTFGITQAINADTIANMQNTNALQTQLSQCCCDIKAGQKDIAYQMATDTCAIQNTMQGTTRDIIEGKIVLNGIILNILDTAGIRKTDQSENQALKFAASQAEQNNYLVNQLRPAPVPAYVTVNPWACNCGVGYNSCCNGLV